MCCAHFSFVNRKTLTNFYSLFSHSIEQAQANLLALLQSRLYAPMFKLPSFFPQRLFGTSSTGGYGASMDLFGLQNIERVTDLVHTKANRWVSNCLSFHFHCASFDFPNNSVQFDSICSESALKALPILISVVLQSKSVSFYLTMNKFHLSHFDFDFEVWAIRRYAEIGWFIGCDWCIDCCAKFG